MCSESYNAISCVWLAKCNELKLGCKKYFFHGHFIQSSAGDAFLLLLSLREGDELMTFLQTEKCLLKEKRKFKSQGSVVSTSSSHEQIDALAAEPSDMSSDSAAIMAVFLFKLCRDCREKEETVVKKKRKKKYASAQ
jgi:hypothetical protein